MHRGGDMSSFIRKDETSALTIRVPASIIARIRVLREEAAKQGYRLNLNDVMGREVDRIVARLESELDKLEPVASESRDSGRTTDQA